MTRGPSLHSGHGKGQQPGKPAPILPSPASILEGAVDEEVGLKSHIHHAITGLKSITARWLGQAAGISEHTAYHKADPNADEARLTWRVLDAAMLSGVPELATGLLNALAKRWGITWGKAGSVAEASDMDVMGALAESRVASAQSMAHEYAVLRDGRVTPAEMTALECQWAAEDAAVDYARDTIRAMAKRTADDDCHKGFRVKVGRA